MTNLADLLPAGGGQNNTDFVADGTITSGAPVVLTAAGKAAAISGTAAGGGTAVNFEAATTMYPAIVYDSANNKMVIFYEDQDNSRYGTAIVGTVSGTSISYGTPVIFNSGTTTYINATYDPDTSQTVTVYKDESNSNYGTAIVGAVSGTSISFGSEAVYASVNVYYNNVTYDTTNDKVVIAYMDYSGSQYGKSLIGTVSGTSISYGSATTFESGSTNYIGICYDSSNDRTVISYQDADDTNKGKAVVGTTSGTSISFGTAVTFESGIISESAAAFDTNVNRVLIAYRLSGSGGVAVAGEVSGTSITFGGTVLITSEPLYIMGIAFDANAGKTIIPYNTPSNTAAYRLASISGTTTTLDSEVAFNAPAQPKYPFVAYNSTEKVDVITFYNNLDNYGYSTVVQVADVSNLTSTNLLGIASGAISDTATGTINTWGSRNEVQTSLTIGSDYYVQTDGRIEAGVTNIAYDISSATYTQNFSVSSQSTDPVGLVFSPDGTSMYVVSGVYPPGAKNIFQYALTTAFDISTASLSKDFDSSGQDSQARGIQFNADGTKMFINGVTGDAYFQYSLSSAYDISTGSYDSVSFSLSSQDGNMEDVVFNADGTKFYGVGLNTYAIYQYSCSSAFDLSTASYDSVSFSISSQDNSPRDLFFKPDGSKMWLLGRQNNSIYQYSLSSAFDLSTASYDSISFSVNSEETSPGGLAFSANGEKFYVCGGTGDDVNQYATTASAFSTDHLIGKAITATQINIKDYTG